MIALLHLGAGLFCLWECLSAARDLRGQFPRLAMFAGLGIIHGFVPVLNLTFVETTTVSIASRQTAAMLAFLGVVLFSIGWRFYDSMKPKWKGLTPGLESVIFSPNGQRLMVRLFWICMIVGVASWAASAILTHGSIGAAFRAGRFEARGQGNFYVDAIIQHFVGLTVVPGFVCFFLPRKYIPLGVGFSLVFAMVHFMSSQGARGAALGLIGCPLMAYTLRYKVTFKTALAIGATGFVLLALAVGLYNVRKVMYGKGVAEVAALLLEPESYAGALQSDPLVYHEVLVQAVEAFPSRHPYLDGATYRRLLVFFIPGGLFPDLKPPDTNITFSAVINPESAAGETTLPPSMMGDGYINFWGFPGGAFIMLFNGILYGFAAYRVRSNALWFVAIGAPFMRFALLSLRGQPYEILLSGLSSLVLVWLIGSITGFSFRYAKAVARHIENQYAWLMAHQPAHTPAAT